ncbi:MAG: hypothetical protein CL489_14875 [Acidobacteria bacterium]|nr:hypothetical protein [Acidobacteriota bacterium]
MSAYNFFMSDIWYKWGNEMHIDFKLWFLNAHSILPTRYESQDEWFCLHLQDTPIAFNYCRVETYKRFNARSFGIKLLEGDSRMSEEEAKELEEQNCEKAFNNIKKHYKHVFFLDDPDRLKKIDKLFVDYDIPVKPNVNITYEHTTDQAYHPLKRDVVMFKDLSTEYQEFAIRMLEYETQFYNKCKNEYT